MGTIRVGMVRMELIRVELIRVDLVQPDATRDGGEGVGVIQGGAKRTDTPRRPIFSASRHARVRHRGATSRDPGSAPRRPVRLTSSSRAPLPARCKVRSKTRKTEPQTPRRRVTAPPPARR
ncbi:hypothetical protein A33M_1150 [Rhodovulum sp. PH10]|nr:hypothetical protein A33M_1150 [Rhodovulum sp. PH10]